MKHHIFAEKSEGKDGSLEIIQDPQFRRLKSTVDMKIAVRLFNNRYRYFNIMEFDRIQNKIRTKNHLLCLITIINSIIIIEMVLTDFNLFDRDTLNLF